MINPRKSELQAIVFLLSLMKQENRIGQVKLRFLLSFIQLT